MSFDLGLGRHNFDAEAKERRILLSDAANSLEELTNDFDGAKVSAEQLIIESGSRLALLFISFRGDGTGQQPIPKQHIADSVSSLFHVVDQIKGCACAYLFTSECRYAPGTALLMQQLRG